MRYIALTAWLIVLAVLVPASCTIGRYQFPVEQATLPQCWEEMRQCRVDTDICRLVVRYPVPCEEDTDDNG